MSKLNLVALLPRASSWIRTIPLVWMLLLFVVPFAIVFKISLAETQIAIPPYSQIVSYADEQLQLAINLGNYLLIFEDDFYLNAYGRSLKVATISTLLCIVIALPMAWAISASKTSTRNILLMLVVLPSWTSFLIRVYAWIGILKDNGLINNVLMAFGVIDKPIQMLYTDGAIYLGIVYTYLPFMVLPLYTALMRLDYSLIEAAKDLGANRLTTFVRVVLPQIKNGLIAGAMLVFIPAIGEFVIPDLLGGPDSVLIGGILWQEFFMNRDWPVAAAIASIMLGLLIVPIMIFHRYQKNELEAGA